MSWKSGSVRAFSRAAGRRKLLSPEEEREIGLRAKSGDLRARQLLVEHNLRIVLMAAGRYSKSQGLRVSDLLQAGAIGLLKAAERFDPDRGRFFTVALLWVRAYMALEARAQRFPMARRSASHSKTKRIEAGHPLVLSTTTCEDEVFELRDESVVHPDEAIDAGREAALVLRFVNRVARTPMELAIISERVLADAPLKHREIAERFGVTRQRVQQVEKGLRERVRSAILEGGLDRARHG